MINSLQYVTDLIIIHYNRQECVILFKILVIELCIVLKLLICHLVFNCAFHGFHLVVCGNDDCKFKLLPEAELAFTYRFHYYDFIKDFI